MKVDGGSWGKTRLKVREGCSFGGPAYRCSAEGVMSTGTWPPQSGAFTGGHEDTSVKSYVRTTTTTTTTATTTTTTTTTTTNTTTATTARHNTHDNHQHFSSTDTGPLHSKWHEACT